MELIGDVGCDWDDCKYVEGEGGKYISVGGKGKGSKKWFVGGKSDGGGS